MQNISNIITWYKKNFRYMPWRASNDPYKIWISEVVLQQTQVVTGLKYYNKIIELYPDISAFANASEEDILLIWKGLGYYSRARNMHKTAQIVVNQYNAVFPNNYSALLKLPGIGDYTASAILAFAYNQAFPTLDGNVFRVIARLYNINVPIDQPANRKVFKDILLDLIQNQNPVLFNNALMELGATVCKPSNPDCHICPASLFCIALNEKSFISLPVKSKSIVKKQRYFNFFYIEYQTFTYIIKRTDQDIWKNLFQLPIFESNEHLLIKQITNTIENQLFKDFNSYSIEVSTNVNHILTHQVLNVQFWKLICSDEPYFLSPNCLKIDKNDYTKYSMPILIHNFLLSL